MEQTLAYSTLALMVALAVTRPRLGRFGFRFTPGRAAFLAVVVLLVTGLLRPVDLRNAAIIQWRPLLTLVSILVMTGVVHQTGAFERLACVVEAHARGTSATRAFTLVFWASVITPSLLNNDAAILLLTPLVVALIRRLYPNRPDLTEAFAFAVFLAPGVAPFVISNPMNMIVAEYAGLGFNAYARVMAPISLAGALVTFGILRLRYRRILDSAVAARGEVAVPPAHPAERPALALLIAVFVAYPIVAASGGSTWMVAAAGAVLSLAIARAYRTGPMQQTLRHVSPDILVFLWGVFLVVGGLRSVGVVDRLSNLYAAAPAASSARLALIGVVSALGSATVDNHPMSILNMLALRSDGGDRPLLAALVGGDIGPRLLPIGSLAGLLWMDLLRRAGVTIGIGKFIRLGTLVLVPTLGLSLLLLAMR